MGVNVTIFMSGGVGEGIVFAGWILQDSAVLFFHSREEGYEGTPGFYS